MISSLGYSLIATSLGYRFNPNQQLYNTSHLCDYWTCIEAIAHIESIRVNFCYFIFPMSDRRTLYNVAYADVVSL